MAGTNSRHLPVRESLGGADAAGGWTARVRLGIQPGQWVLPSPSPAPRTPPGRAGTPGLRQNRRARSDAPYRACKPSSVGRAVLCPPWDATDVPDPSRVSAATHGAHGVTRPTVLRVPSRPSRTTPRPGCWPEPGQHRKLLHINGTKPPWGKCFPCDPGDRRQKLHSYRSNPDSYRSNVSQYHGGMS